MAGLGRLDGAVMGNINVYLLTYSNENCRLAPVGGRGKGAARRTCLRAVASSLGRPDDRMTHAPLTPPEAESLNPITALPRPALRFRVRRNLLRTLPG